MEEYTLLRQFADSWMLLVLFVFFVGINFLGVPPRCQQRIQRHRKHPFRHQDKPAESKEARQ